MLDLTAAFNDQLIECLTFVGDTQLEQSHEIVIEHTPLVNEKRYTFRVCDRWPLHEIQMKAYPQNAASDIRLGKAGGFINAGEFAKILTLLSAPLPPQEELSDKMAFA